MKLAHAYKMYLDRKDRRAHPDGHFDKQGRWFPGDAEEWQECCKAIRSPSAAYPYSYLVHCRSASHIAKLCGVSEAELNSLIRSRKARRVLAAIKRLNQPITDEVIERIFKEIAA